MLQKLLIDAYKHKKIADINMYGEEDSIIGYITYIDKEFFTIEEIDKFGNAIGSTTYAIAKIANLSLDNWYLRSLQIIICNRDKLNEEKRITIHKDGKELLPEIEYLKVNEIIVMLFFEEDQYELGFILDYDENFILLKDVGQDGCVLGITCYQLNEVVGLRYNGLGEQKTRILYDSKNGSSAF